MNFLTLTMYFLTRGSKHIRGTKTVILFSILFENTLPVHVLGPFSFCIMRFAIEREKRHAQKTEQWGVSISYLGTKEEKEIKKFKKDFNDFSRQESVICYFLFRFFASLRATHFVFAERVVLIFRWRFHFFVGLSLNDVLFILRLCQARTLGAR